MHRLTKVCLLAALPFAPTGAQQVAPWKAIGDPPGAPAGCEVGAAVKAIDAFFAAMRVADSAALVATTALSSGGKFVFTTGQFTRTDTFANVRTAPELLSYARKRLRHQERIVVQQVTFNRWEGDRLEFGPIYFLRSADDLGQSPLPGVGKGEYRCAKGLTVLGTAPRPAFDRGPG